MPPSFRWLVLFHAVAGAVALVIMWVPMVAKKGGRAHRRAGQVYAVAMGVAALSALVGCVWRLIADPPRREGALFLGLVAVLSATSTWWGVRVLDQKKRTGAHRGPLEWASAGLLALAGVLGVVYAAMGATPLFAVFGVLSAFLGLGRLRKLARAPESRWFWWYEHLGGMLISCIGTLTAFLVVNHSHAPASFRAAIPPMVVWVAPGVLGGIAIVVWNRHYRRVLERTASVSPD